MNRKSAKTLIWVFIAAALALAPLVPGLIDNSFFAHVLILILLYAAMAQSWNIIGGFGGQVSFGHSVFFGIGAYGAAISVCKFGATPWVGIIAGMVVAVAVSIVISAPCFRLKGHYFAIATFAIVEIFNRLFLVWDGIGGAIGLDYPIVDDGAAFFMWSNTKVGYYYGALILAALVFGIVRIFLHRRFGYRLRAVRDGQEVAESLGINSLSVKLRAMALSAALSSLCGAFYAQYSLRVDPSTVISLDVSMRFVLVAILGGVGTFSGPLLGAVILLPLQEYTRAYLAYLGPGIDLVIFGILIMVVMAFEPRGAAGIIAYIVSYFDRRRKKHGGLADGAA